MSDAKPPAPLMLPLPTTNTNAGLRRARCPQARRGSALVLVLVMTLAVAALAVAAIFLSSSAGLLSRFYDRERDFRLAAESALEVIRSRMEWDGAFPTIGDGVVQVAAGMRIRGADGALEPRVSVNVWAVQAGDTGATRLPTVTLLAVAYDAAGTRYARRMDLRRESFSNYQLFVDTFPSGAFGPGQVAGRVHTNDVWRSSASAATAPTYRGRVTAVNGFAGLGTFLADSVRGVAEISYPSDSTFPELAALAAAGGLSITPVNNGMFGNVNGSRVEFVARDLDGNGSVTASEGFLRVFDLEPFRDTVYLRVGLEYRPWWYPGGISFEWSHETIQNQCGAFYFRNSEWHFIPVATHRQSWFNNASNGLLVGTGGSNYPSIPNGQRNNYTGYDYNDTRRILELPTARCFPPGSPYLVNTERFTDVSCQITGSYLTDTIPFGAASGCFPSGKYGGSDTTFSKRSRRCSFTAGGSCDEVNNIGLWRDYPGPGGNALVDVPTTVMQVAEQETLWPLAPPRNSNATGVVHLNGGPIFVSGTVASRVTVLAQNAVEIIDDLRTAPEPAADSADCEHQLGVVAVGDILTADNAITRGRRISQTFFGSSFATSLGGTQGSVIQAHLMSLTGTVGVADPGRNGHLPQPCPGVSSSNSSGGCWYLQGSAAMRRFGGFSNGTNQGLHYAGTPSHCPATSRPPHFPLVNRYTVLQSVDIAPSLANTPAKVQALLLRLKGKSL